MSHHSLPFLLHQTMTQPVTEETFVNEASTMTCGAPSTSRRTFSRRFRSHFGLSVSVTFALWGRLEGFVPRTFEPRYLLWGLFFLKFYNTEHVNATVAGVEEKTFRYWSWINVLALSNIDLISWSSRLSGLCVSNEYISVDGTDFRIQEPTPFDPAWYSFKFHGPGLRYEVGLSIQSGVIVWLNGRYPCGAYNDVQIFRERLKSSLGPGELVIGDRWYTDPKCVTPNCESQSASRMHSVIRAGLETMNKRFKQFNILKQVYRHDLTFHSTVMFAVANVTQAMNLLSDPVFTIDASHI